MFELALPEVLPLVLVPLVVWFVIPKAALASQEALKLPFYNTLAGMIDSEKGSFIASKSVLFFYVIWLLLVLALAGPRWVGAPIPIQQEGRNLMLVLDLSESMGLEDMVSNGQAISRLKVVKRAAKQFVEERIGDRIGLIVFGTRAYLQTPLTFDRKNILSRLDDSTVGLAGNSTSIGDALGLAVKRLQNVSKKSRVIILLTDGANNTGLLTPAKAAELAKDDKIKVYTIGLGSNEASWFNSGQNPSLDEKTLEDIANMTGGRYFLATDSKSLESIYRTINQLETVSEKAQAIRPKKEYYPWPLALALSLFMGFTGSKMGLWQPYRRPLERGRSS